MQQPEGLMLYEEAEFDFRERGSCVVVLPLYEYRLCCPVHPPHEYDLDDLTNDIGSVRHRKWRAEQTNNLHFQRLAEAHIMDKWRIEHNWHEFGGVIPERGYTR